MDAESGIVARLVPATLVTGAALTLSAAVLPMTGYFRELLGEHVRVGYPALDSAEVDSAVTAYVAILVAIGVAGLIGWGIALRAVRTGFRGTRWLMAALLATGALIAVSALTIRDTSGDVGLAPFFGWLLLVPCLPGLVALASWRRPA